MPSSRRSNTATPVEDRVLSPVRTERERGKLARERTAATRVEFFTLVRGED